MENKIKTTLIKAARAGGAVLIKYFGKALNPVEKSTVWDFQTEADVGSEKEILKILRREFPNYNIHAEETGKIDNGAEFTFVIDPLDGTNNFVLGIPNFTVSIALLNKKEAVAGIVYQPILNQVYYAEKGKGAYLNNKKIKVSRITDSKKMTIAYNCGYKNSRNRVKDVLSHLTASNHKRILVNWSPAYDYCLLASGKIEAMLSDAGTELYDFGAGKLIALEAGGKIYNHRGGKDTDFRNDKFVLSNNNKIAQNVLKSIKLINKNSFKNRQLKNPT